MVGWILLAGFMVILAVAGREWWLARLARKNPLGEAADFHVPYMADLDGRHDERPHDHQLHDPSHDQSHGHMDSGGHPGD